MANESRGTLIFRKLREKAEGLEYPQVLRTHTLPSAFSLRVNM
jgi:hypothetical protein